MRRDEIADLAAFVGFAEALDGHGTAYLQLDKVQAHINAGRQKGVLSKFTPNLPGYHLYYPHR